MTTVLRVCNGGGGGLSVPSAVVQHAALPQLHWATLGPLNRDCRSFGGGLVIGVASGHPVDV